MMHGTGATNKPVSAVKEEISKPLSVPVADEDKKDDTGKPDSYDKSKKKSPLTFCNQLWNHWASRNDFLMAQISMVGVLMAAWIGNNWPYSYPRNDNENSVMFWLMNLALVVAALYSVKQEPTSANRGLQVLSRSQTEEWKGWMQWAFIMYHYYRARFVYNEIRVFVSSYVFMTGWGNWQYFDKKKDFSLERAISMWLRINYFPLLLCLVVGTKLDDFYIVPLHTAGFFVTMATAYLAHKLEPKIKGSEKRKMVAIGISLLAHIIFYETPLVRVLNLFSSEIFFRFQADKYSCWVGILFGYLWPHVKKAAQFYNTPPPSDLHQNIVSGAQVMAGICCIAFWFGMCGHIRDKYTYNPLHPYVFWLPLVGWLIIRNSSRYLMEVHSTALEYFGRITLETYVLQFHLFMCRHVQHIPVVIPGAGADGFIILKIANMLLTGVVFVTVAYYARQFTVETQTTVTQLVSVVQKFVQTGTWPELSEAEKSRMSDREYSASFRTRQSLSNARGQAEAFVRKAQGYAQSRKWEATVEKDEEVVSLTKEENGGKSESAV